MNVIANKLAVEKLNIGLPIIFHTDTLPAIGCLPKFSEIIYKIKQRDVKKPLILMGAESFQLNEFVHKTAFEDYKYMASRYWPGPLTMIIPISEKSKPLFSNKNLTLGLRIPNSIMANYLIKESGPLLTSSANISGLPPSTNAKDISFDLPNVDILGPVPWPKCSGKASTIISWVNNEKWKLIREGEVFIPGIK
ncbi:Putative translation factor (SUA5) [Prochlorococcus marinus str. MIT 9515]|uniref:L-threonylcarbamoyladenylate synthase n=1 Tax=Prochlorococcus marinus (strain MIT 9515) TaxID=167542 RepID=A2BUU9_PROM5|nr:L-threonylcarbamoyladenylate synthase [Prochlorococcus marinus]ABM71560.1 Putative translation factor (SUA5) [Prochlorococcus marinus str. MIT 9515]